MVLYAQTEAEIKENAEQLFEKEQFVEATPMYLRLLSLQPRDYNYNYKYGTCLLFNSSKKQDAIRYLSYAVTSESIDPAVHFFLGRAYHLNYQFNDAIKEYQKYQSLAGVKGRYTSDALRNMEMCRNGKKLLSTITEIIVTKKSEIKSADFFRIYDLSNIGGSFVVAIDFQSKMDKKMNHIPLVHFPQGTDKIFYSSYGDGSQKDIYMVRRLPDGKFSLPQLVIGGVNSPFEEDYPYLHPSGNYLYFSSKGHNSMGGYDVFRSRFDPDNNSFGPAENIDFAISSPDDDILYVVDKDDKNAYFASSRQSQDGKLFVYQVKVDRVPIQLAVVKGYFESGINPENKSMTVEVIDKLSDKNIGTFKTNAKGSYLVTFPKGGKYEYHVTIDGSNEKFTCQVEIPYLKEFKPLKQKMLHEVMNNKENVRIVNLFNEEVDDAQAIIAQVLKDRSDLNVNVDKFDLNELEILQESKKILSEIGASEMSVFEVGQMLQRRSVELTNVDKGLSKEQSAVNALVVVKTKRIKEIDIEVKELVKEADQSESDVVQHSILMEAKQLIAERNSLLNSINEVEKVGVEIGGNEVNKVDQQKFNELQKSYNVLLNSDKQAEALQIVKNNNAFIKKILQGEGNTHEDDLIGELKKVEDKIDKEKKVSIAFEKDINQTEAEIRTLEEQKSNVKEKLKAEIQDNIDYKKQQLEEFKAQRNSAQDKQTELAKQRKKIADELEMIRSIQNYAGDSVTTEQAAKAKSELSNENAKSLSQYVESQISELVKNNPSLENSKGNLSESAIIIAIHNSKAEGVLGDSGLSESEIKAFIKKLNTETLNELQERFSVAKSMLTNDKFNDELAKELAVNEKFSAKLKVENEGNGQIASTTKYSNEELEKELNPTYASTVSEITNNSNFSEKEKWTALNDADNSYRSTVEKELVIVENQLKQTPQNKELINKKNVLVTKELELIESIEERNKQIAAINENVTVNNVTEASVTAQIDPEYSEKKNNLNPNDIDELKKIQALDEGFLNQLKESNKLVQDKKKQFPSDQKLIKQGQIMEQLISQTEKEIATRSIKIKELDNSQVSVVKVKSDEEVKNDLLTSIPVAIESEIDKIENSSNTSTQKQQDIIDKRTEYVELLENRKALKMKEDKGDDELVKREIALLDEMILSQNVIIENLKSEQTTNSVAVLSTKEDVVNQVNANHSNEIDELKAADLSEKEKNEKIIASEKSYLSELKSTLSTKEKEQKKDDENPVLANDIRILKELIIEQETLIDELINTSNSLVELPTNESVLKDVDPSFKSDISKIEKSKGIEKFNLLIKREQELQTNLENKIAEVQSELGIDPDNESLKTELALATSEYQSSITRVGEYAKERTTIQENSSVDSKEMITELRKSLINEENGNPLEKTFTTEAELKAQDALLATYEVRISEKLNELKQLNDASETKRRTQEIEVLEKELGLVQKKRRSVSVSIGEIEQNSMVRTPENSEEKRLVLNAKESELQAKLNESETTPKERKVIEKELQTVSNEKANLEIPIVNEKIETNKVILASLVQNAKTPTSTEIKNQLSAKEAVIDDLLEKASKEKSSIAKNFLLNEVLSLQKEAKDDFMESKIDERNNQIQELNGISVNSSKAELEAKVRRFSVEVGEITQELDAQKKAQLVAKSAKKAAFNAPIESLEADLLVAELNLKNAELALSRIVEKDETVAKESVKTEITFDEEFQIASSDEYENYAQLAKSALDIENQIVNFESQIAGEDAEIKKLIEEEVYEGADYSVAINDHAQKIRTYSVEIGELQKQLDERKRAIVEFTPTNADQHMKFDNLVMRGINPIKKAAVAFAFIPLPASGIEINPVGTESNYTDSNPIPVNVESPSGLVYRVQVGAFARPIPQDLFKEFTPVSGEKIANTNITRYMAGFFNNSDKVVNAREQIKALGYSDAFIVAYCDGKRISFGEARNLEKSGECIPKGTNEMMLEVAEKTSIAMGYEDTSKVVTSVSEYSYNQSPGAAKAEAIERIEGLFFTVQIAVHNRPVSHEQLLNLDPLMTLRLPNGQIRYSCGKFLDIEKAKTVQNEIKAKGIIDAFITAYYNGERIGWQKGVEMQQKEGASIMSNLTTVKDSRIEDKQVQNSTVIEVFKDVPKAIKPPVEKGIQLVSKETFSEYPRDVLNRYNAKGSFFYDERDKKVKSVIYDSEDHLPRIQEFKSDIDTVYLTMKELNSPKGNTIIIHSPKSKLDGDFSDWLLKMNYRKEISRLKNGLEIRIFDVRDMSLEKVKNELALFGLTMEVEHGEGVKEIRE